MRILFTCLCFIMPGLLFAQGGYVLDPQTITWPDTAINLETTTLPVPTNREDVKSVGMGKTQIANGRTFNAMTYNPALLSRKRFSIDGIAAGISLPPKTYDAANYLNDHISEFKDAVSLKELWAGVTDFNNAATVQDQLAALKRIQQGLKFPHELLQNVAGTSENPTTHGIRATPAFQFQYDNFGLSVYAVGQSAFEVEQSPIIDALLAVPLPEDLNDPQQVSNAIVALAGILQPIMELNNFDDALPFAYSMSYLDVVANAGYAYDFTPDLTIGASLKVVHRRFSARKILLEEYDNIINLFKQDFNQNITGVTADLGALYKFPFKTEVGLSIQNIIPTQKITSTLRTDFALSFLTYKTDQFGNVVLTEQGDTVVQSNSLKINFGLPFELELPMIISIGAIHPITENWDVAFDWVDITDKDARFETYAERFRLGSEYRLDAIKDRLGVAFRAGMADKRFTGGIGLNIYRALQIDGAYAWDNYVGAYSYFVQVKLGW